MPSPISVIIFITQSVLPEKHKASKAPNITCLPHTLVMFFWIKNKKQNKKKTS
uniref:Uncharacterized protein n=1 Tax=Anguilla anguilla TaxID=7936 RepID=A0A0E9S0P3_ANGAN